MTSPTPKNSKSHYLKHLNAPTVILFVVWCAVLLFAFHYGTTSYEDFKALFARLNARDSLILSLSPIILLVLSGLVSSEGKARLVFWRWKHPLPGSRAFSKLMRRDSRIDVPKLKRKLGSIPRGPREQNTLWFSIYRKYQNRQLVSEPHRLFLLSRDISVIAFLLAIASPILLLCLGGSKITATICFLVMGLQYLLLAVVARNYGERLVCNVLLEHLHDDNA